MPLLELKVPDIGDIQNVVVIEVLIQPGATIKPEQSLITVESDKASMEIPATQGGVIQELKVKLGDQVSQGTVIALLQVTDEAMPTSPLAAPLALDKVASTAQPVESLDTLAPIAAQATTSQASPSRVHVAETLAPHAPLAQLKHADFSQATTTLAHASPSVRRYARELGVPLAQVKGSGPKNRITHTDVQAFVKEALANPAQQAPASAATTLAATDSLLTVLPWPKVDFSPFGPTQRQPLSRIKKLAGANLHRNWVRIPHVTNHDEADITALEAFRIELNQELAREGVKLTLLAFLIKACVAALKKFPAFNASLEGDDLILKQYYHIGFAADTPQGLVVPVIRDADQKGLLQLAQESAELAKLARESKLTPTQMQGGCFSISSLGGIGGTTFTPIINAPEVAILGVCRAATKPIWDGQNFVPRLTLPLSLSYDHRVIDGAAAARFNSFLIQLLADFRRISL